MAAVIAAVVVSRFARVGGSDALARLSRSRAPAPSFKQFSYRADLMRRVAAEATFDPALRDAHFGVLLAAVAAGRREIIRLHHAGRISDDTLHAIEYDLDLQEISARRVLDMRPA